MQEQLKMMQGEKALIKEEVDAEDIADVVSRWTGIPCQQNGAERKREAPAPRRRAHSRVVGQDEAIAAIADAVRRSRAASTTLSVLLAPSSSLAPRVWARPS